MVGEEEEEGEKVQESIAGRFFFMFVCLFCGVKFKFGWPEL